MPSFCWSPHKVRKGKYWICHHLSVRSYQIAQKVFVTRNIYWRQASNTRYAGKRKAGGLSPMSSCFISPHSDDLPNYIIDPAKSQVVISIKGSMGNCSAETERVVRTQKLYSRMMSSYRVCYPLSGGKTCLFPAATGRGGEITGYPWSYRRSESSFNLNLIYYRDKSREECRQAGVKGAVIIYAPPLFDSWKKICPTPFCPWDDLK